MNDNLRAALAVFLILLAGSLLLGLLFQYAPRW